MGIIDSMLVKYGAVCTGYAIVGLPVFGPNREQYLKTISSDPTQITKDYVRNSSLLINLAKAIGRIVVSYKDVQNLAGYTTLIHEMDEVLQDLKKDTFVRVQVNDNSTSPGGPEGGVKEKTLNYAPSTQDKSRIIISDNLKFVDVPIISPNGDVLIDKMTFEI